MRAFQMMGSRHAILTDLSQVVSFNQVDGFSLLELTIVMGIIGFLLWITIPAIQNINGAQTLSRNTTDVAGILTLARAQAMMRNSYVYVGFYESDGSKSDSTRPAPVGTGRLWIGVAATLDGTQSYNTTNNTSWTVSNLTPIGKLRFFDNLHLATNAPFYTSTITANTVSPVGDPSATNTPFGWPLENSNTVTTFSQGIIEFTPQGTAMLPGAAALPEYIQLALIPTHGNQLPNNISNAAVVQVDAVTGAVRTFRP